MRVLFTTNIPSPYRVDFFNELGKQCDLTVLFEARTDKSRDKNWMAEKATSFKTVFLKGIKRGNAEGFCPGVLKYLSPKKFDLIVVGAYHTPTGMLAIQYMKSRKIHFILSSDGGLIKEDRGLKHKLKERFIGSADLWMSTGKTTNDYLSYYGADKKRIFIYPFTSIRQSEVLNHAITQEEKEILREKLGITYEKMILSVGQFVFRKGYDLLLKACEGLDKSIGIYIIGGKPTDEYIQMARTMNLNNVHFIDFKKKEELSEYYKAADLFVLPTREDVWGLVINEAMSFGLPIVTTDRCVAGLEMVNPKVGKIIPSEDIDSLRKAMLDALWENYSHDDIVKVARKYTIESMAEAHLRVFKEMESMNKIKQIKQDKQARPMKATYKKVLHVSPGFTGGIASHINNIILGINEEKLIIDVAAFPADKDNAGAFLHDIKAKKGKAFDLLKPKANPFKFYRHIYKLIKVNGPYEAIHIHMHGFRFVFISLIARSAGAKRIISHAHIADGKDSSKLINRIKRSISVLSTKLFATQYASCSKYASNYVFGKKSVDKCQVMHIPNGIDSHKYDTKLSAKQVAELKKQLGIGEYSIIIGHIGYFGYQKNHPFMLQIIKKLAETGEHFVWLFIGIGHDMDAIKKIVVKEKLEPYVRFLGYRKDIPKLLKLMDVMVLPSIFEGLPTVAVEAQAAGTPCLMSTNISPETDLKLDLCYFMSLEEDISIWCRKIKEMAATKGSINSSVLKMVEEKCFTTSTAAKLYEKFIYNEILHYEF